MTWLATERKKVAYRLEQRELTVDDLPLLTFESRGGRSAATDPSKR